MLPVILSSPASLSVELQKKSLFSQMYLTLLEQTKISSFVLLYIIFLCDAGSQAD